MKDKQNNRYNMQDFNRKWNNPHIIEIPFITHGLLEQGSSKKEHHGPYPNPDTFGPEPSADDK